MVNCKLDLNAIMADNSAGGSPALLFVYLFYHQLFVTGVTKTSKTGLSLFLSSGSLLRFSKSETDPQNRAKNGLTGHAASCYKTLALIRAKTIKNGLFVSNGGRQLRGQLYAVVQKHIFFICLNALLYLSEGTNMDASLRNVLRHIIWHR